MQYNVWFCDHVNWITKFEYAVSVYFVNWNNIPHNKTPGNVSESRKSASRYDGKNDPPPVMLPKHLGGMFFVLRKAEIFRRYFNDVFFALYTWTAAPLVLLREETWCCFWRRARAWLWIHPLLLGLGHGKLRLRLEWVTVGISIRGSKRDPKI